MERVKRKIEIYDRLNDPDYAEGEFVHKIPLDELAKDILTMNYGLPRLLSALNRVVNDPKNEKLSYQRAEVEAIVKALEDYSQ